MDKWNIIPFSSVKLIHCISISFHVKIVIGKLFNNLSLWEVIVLNIVIVGAGNGGTNILKSFSNIEDIKITMIIDTNFNAPGILLAKELNIQYSGSIDDINRSQTDIIIEATGSQKVDQLLNERFGNTCTIFNSQAAYLIMTLVQRDIQTLEKMNTHMEVISNTSNIVQKQLQEITDSIEQINTVSTSLMNSTNLSNEYIKKSDQITQSVNKIAHKTKILGINASIEAARAGEHGRGFSIVAREVENLATYSENFAKEINEILVQLSDEIGNINVEVDKLTDLSKIQVDASNEATTAVDELVTQTL